MNHSKRLATPAKTAQRKILGPAKGYSFKNRDQFVKKTMAAVLKFRNQGFTHEQIAKNMNKEGFRTISNLKWSRHNISHFLWLNS